MGYRRKITEAICFYTTPEMRSDIEKMAEEKDVTISELMREIVAFYRANAINTACIGMEWDSRRGEN